MVNRLEKKRGIDYVVCRKSDNDIFSSRYIGYNFTDVYYGNAWEKVWKFKVIWNKCDRNVIWKLNNTALDKDVIIILSYR